MVSFRDRVHAMELSVFGKGGHSAYAKKKYGKPKTYSKGTWKSPKMTISSALSFVTSYVRLAQRNRYAKKR